MTIHKRRLILRLVRLQHAVDDMRGRWAEAYDIDSLVDGGEFSGPAIARSMERDREALAVRFGFTTYEVAGLVIDHLDADLRSPAVLHGYPAPLPN